MDYGDLVSAHSDVIHINYLLILHIQSKSKLDTKQDRKLKNSVWNIQKITITFTF